MKNFIKKSSEDGRFRLLRMTLACVALLATTVACSTPDDGAVGDDDTPSNTETSDDADEEADSEAGGDDEAAADDIIPVKLALGSTSFVYQTVFIAQEAGIFEEHGLEVEIVQAGSGADSITILLSGDTQFAGSGAPEPIAVRAQDQDIRMLARLYAGLSGTVVLSEAAVEASGVSPDAPIEERLQALDGLTFAFSSPTTGFLPPMDAALNMVGASVNKTYIGQGEMPAALSQGNIDAMIASSPVSDAAVVQFNGVSWISGPRGEFPEEAVPPMTSVLSTTQSFIDSNPEAVRRMSDALVASAEFVSENGEEAKQIVAARFPDVDADVFESAWEANVTAYAAPWLTPEDIEQLISILPDDLKTEAVTSLDPAEYLAGDFVPVEAG